MEYLKKYSGGYMGKCIWEYTKKHLAEYLKKCIKGIPEEMHRGNA